MEWGRNRITPLRLGIEYFEVGETCLTRCLWDACAADEGYLSLCIGVVVDGADGDVVNEELDSASLRDDEQCILFTYWGNGGTCSWVEQVDISRTRSAIMAAEEELTLTGYLEVVVLVVVGAEEHTNILPAL